MKKILLLALAFMSVNVFAQEGKADMSKYMGDIIPLEDGKVVFSTTIEAQGLASGQIYDIAYRWMELFLKERKVDRRDPDTKIFEEKEKGEIASMPEHYLVFNKTFLSVDRTFMKYRMRFTVENEKMDVKIWSITYEYYTPDKKEPERYTAENAITDEYALDKTKTKLNQNTSKFRVKTVDMIDDIFASLNKTINSEVSKMNLAVAKAERQIKQDEMDKATPKTAQVAAQQPSMAELQQQLAAQKSGKTAPSKIVPTPTVLPSAEKQTPVPVQKTTEHIKPMQTAPVSSGGYTIVDVKSLPANIIKVMSDGGMAVSANGEAAVALWGGMGTLYGKNVAVCYINPSQPAYSILEENDTYTLTFGFDGNTVVLLCKKMLSQSLTLDGVSDPVEKAKLASSAMPKMFIGEIINAKVK